MGKQVNSPVIVAYGRSAIGKAIKGSLAAIHPVDYAAQVLQGVIGRLPGLNTSLIDDIIVGCAMPYNEQGMNMARLISMRAIIPYSVPAQTVNRYCSSGLQTIATAANAIVAGQAQMVVAGGVERMNQNSLLFNEKDYNSWLNEHEPGAYMAMGITAENVAKKYTISRASMDAYSVESHRRATEASERGQFKCEIIPIQTADLEGNPKFFDKDECIRKDSTSERLAELSPAFQEAGTVTAGNSSQLSDGAAFVVLMSDEKAVEWGFTPIARFIGFSVVGVDPRVMGIGPIEAIPKVMRLTGLNITQMDVIELNEAFAAQALACINTLGLDQSKVNPNGGAIALGHPLGATGSVLTCKALNELEQKGGRYALVTMCIGGGMGAAGIFERLN